jgi:hypothetical protein
VNGAKPEDVYKFSKVKVVWLIPPINILGDFYDDNVYFSGTKWSVVGTDFDTYARNVNKLLDKKDMQQVINYILNFVSSVAKLNNTSIYSQSDSFYTMYGRNCVGIKDSYILGARAKVPPEFDLINYSTLPRGATTVSTFDILDRFKLWMEERFDTLQDYQPVEYGLAKLKLSGSIKAIYAVEQEFLRGTGSSSAIYAVTANTYKLYTDDLLDYIRDIWDEPNMGISNKYFEILDAVKPLCIDTVQWRKLFRVDPSTIGEKLTRAKAEAVIKGYDRFIDYYLMMQRKGKKC